MLKPSLVGERDVSQTSSMQVEAGARRAMNKGLWSTGEGVTNSNGGEENFTEEMM